MTWTIEDMPDLTGRVVVITGPDCPRGRAMVRRLVREGAQVVMVGDAIEELARTRLDVLAELPHARLGIVSLAARSIDGCVAAARAVLEIHPRIDVLVNNRCPALSAPTTGRPEVPAARADAIGLYAFTIALVPGLVASDDPRIVTMTPRSDHPTPDGNGGGRDEPEGSPPVLSVADFAQALHHRMHRADLPIRCLAASPDSHSGLACRDMADNAPLGPLGHRMARRLADREAAPALRAATDPAAPTGHLFTARGAGDTAGHRPMPRPGSSAGRGWATARRRAGVDVVVEPPARLAS